MGGVDEMPTASSTLSRVRDMRGSMCVGKKKAAAEAAASNSQSLKLMLPETIVSTGTSAKVELTQ